MKWDEEKFGLEYDLDIFNVVAVNDFNMGAMENKGLNVFNTAFVLAKPGAHARAISCHISLFFAFHFSLSFFVCIVYFPTLFPSLKHLSLISIFFISFIIYFSFWFD